jgi:hypothetical protein
LLNWLLPTLRLLLLKKPLLMVETSWQRVSTSLSSLTPSQRLQRKANAIGSDSEAFFALEQIKQNEKDLQEMFIYQGRAGLWDDWLSFQAEAKRKREAEAKALALAKIKRKEKIWAWINGILIAVSVLSGVIFIAAVVWFIYTKGGNG